MKAVRRLADCGREGSPSREGTSYVENPQMGRGRRDSRRGSVRAAANLPGRKKVKPVAKIGKNSEEGNCKKEGCLHRGEGLYREINRSTGRQGRGRRNRQVSRKSRCG